MSADTSDRRPPHASRSEESWKDALTRLDRVDSCVLMFMRNCIRLPDIDYEGFLYQADMTHKANCTLERCQSIWHVGITQLAKSTHSGLQRQGRILRKKWARKEYAHIEYSFNLYLERKRGLDRGSLKALKASDTYWSERTCHDYGKAAEELRQQAGQKHSRDSFVNERSSRWKSPRNGSRSPSEVERDDEDETAIEDLNVLGGQDGQGVFSDEDNTDEDDEDVESIEDLSNELVELIERSEPCLHLLIRALYHAVRKEPFKKPRGQPELSEPQDFLYNFVWERLDKFTTLRPIEQKDVFVAISGIVDLDVHKLFPNHNERVTECRNVLPQLEGLVLLEKYKTKFVVDDGDDVLEADLTNLKAELEQDLSKFRDGSDEKIVIEILLVLVKLSLPDTFKRPKATETSMLFVWHSIWQTLFSQTAVSVQVGETILKEAQVDQLLVRQIVGPGAFKGAKGAYGRRLDFRLTACIQKAVGSISVTLCNNEHKALSVSHQNLELQHRKNMRLNKSILTRGSTPPGMQTLFWDVVGLEGRMYALRPFKDVLLSCEVQESIKLPTNSFEMGTFLFGSQLNILLAYRKHILSLARKCQGFASKPALSKTPTHSPRLLPTFYTPTLQRTKVVL